MTRLFLRFYVALAVVVAIAGLLALGLERVEGDDPTLPARLQTIAEAPQAVAEQLAAATDPVSREAALARLSEQLGAPVSTEPIARLTHDLDPLRADRLRRGEPVVARWGGVATALIVPVPDQPLVAVIRPERAQAVAWRPVALVLTLIFGLFTAVYVTLRPLQQQLVALSRSAGAVGQGQLDARAPVLTEDAAGALAQNFNDMAERVEELVRGREELLMAVAHELRHPVARLRFAIEMMAEVEDPAARAAQAAELQRDLSELDGLVSELQDYARLEDGRRPLNLQELDVAEELVELVADAERMAAEVEVRLEAGALPPLNADPRLLRRAVGNLLSNAVRYSNGAVLVRAEDLGSSMTIAVEDDGPGVPEADRERVFEPMVRLDSARARDTGGVGLGLALVQRIVERHGGAVRVGESALGGAAFVVELPLSGTPSSAPA